MFEHVQRRNRRPVFVPILIGAVLLVVIYFAVDRWSQRRGDEEASETLNALARDVIAARDDDEPLERAPLPGMSIELPRSSMRKGDYVSGTMQSSSVMFGWTPGKLIADQAFMRDQLKIFGAGETMTTTRFGRAPAFEDHVGERLHVVIGSCGRRNVVLQAQTTRERFEQIKASFKCSPDRPLDHLGVIVAARKGWRRTDDDPKIKLCDDTGIQLTLQSRKEAHDPRGQLIPADVEPEARGDYRVWRGRGTGLDGKPLVTALVDWKCADQPYYGEVFMTGPRSVEEGIALALTGSCIAMTAPLPEHLAPPQAEN